MNKRLNTTKLSAVCFLASCLSAPSVIADWSGEQQFKTQNPGYGDFPPQDIEQKLFSNLNEDGTTTGSQTNDTNAASQVVQNQQDPNAEFYESYKREQRAAQQRHKDRRGNYNNQRNNQANLSGPRNNRGGGFSMPFGNNNNRGGNFSGPWNNNGSGSNFSGPWNNNRGSGFSGPWNNGSRNNGGNFSMPWGNNNGGNNNGSNFSPWGNGSGFSW